MSFEAKVAIGLVASFVMLVYGVTLLGDSIERSACAKIQKNTGLETRYPDHFNMDEGCFVKLKSGQWVPLRNWRPE